MNSAPLTETAPPPGRSRPGGVRSWLLGVNPAAKLITAVVLSLGLIPAVDPVTGGVVLAVTAAAFAVLLELRQLTARPAARTAREPR